MDGGLASDLRGGFFVDYPEALLVTNLEGGLLEVNAAARTAFGADFASPVKLCDRVHPEDRERLESILVRARESGFSARDNIRFERAGGEHGRMTVEARRGAREACLYVSVSPFDQEAQERHVLRVLLAKLDIVAWAIDPKGVFTYHDGQGARKAGIESGALVGKNVFDLYPEEENGITHQALRGIPARNVSSGGSSGNVEYWDHHYVPVRGADGDVTGVVGLSIDVTETQRAQLELAQKLEIIERQQEVIRNLETPVLQVWDGVIALPLVGVIDSSRSARVMDDLLAAVSRTQARFALLDLTGVEVVDTSTANHIIGMIRAIGLLGAAGVVTGIRPNVAQTIVSLGMDLSKLTTLGNLRQGLSYCIKRMADGRRVGGEALGR
jgi:rsbT co-antagonist protein RsbR